MAQIDTGIDITDGTNTVYVHAERLEWDSQKTGAIDISIPSIAAYGANPTEDRDYMDLGTRNRMFTLTGWIDASSTTGFNTASGDEQSAATARDQLMNIFNRATVCTFNGLDLTSRDVILHKVKITWPNDDSGTVSTSPFRYQVIMTMIDSVSSLG